MKEKVECFLIWNVSARILSLAFNQKPYLLVKTSLETTYVCG